MHSLLTLSNHFMWPSINHLEACWDFFFKVSCDLCLGTPVRGAMEKLYQHDFINRRMSLFFQNFESYMPAPNNLLIPSPSVPVWNSLNMSLNLKPCSSQLSHLTASPTASGIHWSWSFLTVRVNLPHRYSQESDNKQGRRGYFDL